MADLDLHVLVHSIVLDKVFVQEADWPLIIADFLAGEDNIWIEEISEDWLELCKKELKNFRFRDTLLSASRTHAPLPIRPVPPVALPFERWGIDFYGPMVETKSGSKYLITCIDYATRWVLAKPVREMTEAAVATFLYEFDDDLWGAFRDYF
ncbi:hypothetical protein BASA83_005350 [Batrachochytrium salamandrivorans]|nr:hypothetical protein BASA83_005350 [Batrachochytrium salamandrivorans]